MRRLWTVLTLVVLAIPASALASTLSTPDAERTASGTAPVVDGGPRVRPGDDRSRAALKDGVARSEIIRRLLVQLERYDVIAYVAMQHRLRGHLSGSLTWVVATERFRYVRVSLNPDLSGEELIATLAHELQHVVEVAQAPLVVDPGTLSALYRRIGIERLSHTEAFDTEAAKRVGEQVRRELAVGTTTLGEFAQLGR